MPPRTRPHQRLILATFATLALGIAPSLVSSKGTGVAFDAAVAQESIGEKEAFEAAKELGTVDAWEAFLARFEKGFRADLARAYIRKLSDTAGGSEQEKGLPQTSGSAAATQGQPPQPTPLARGQQMSDPNAPGVVFEVLFGHFRAMATQRYFAAGSGSYKICMQECAASDTCNFWVFQPADPKFVNQGSVDRCFLMAQAGRATPSPWCSGCTTGRRMTVPEPLSVNPALPTYANVRWEKTPPRLKSGGGTSRAHQQRERVERLRCGKNYRLRRGKCVPKQNCGKHAYRNVEGDCHCKKHYEWRGGRCQWKVNKNGFEIEPWLKPGCKDLDRQCKGGNGKACMKYEERCQPN